MLMILQKEKIHNYSVLNSFKSLPLKLEITVKKTALPGPIYKKQKKRWDLKKDFMRTKILFFHFGNIRVNLK